MSIALRNLLQQRSRYVAKLGVELADVLVSIRMTAFVE
jgi:hypothetical protein